MRDIYIQRSSSVSSRRDSQLKIIGLIFFCFEGDPCELLVLSSLNVRIGSSILSGVSSSLSIQHGCWWCRCASMCLDWDKTLEKQINIVPLKIRMQWWSQFTHLSISILFKSLSDRRCVEDVFSSNGRSWLQTTTTTTTTIIIAIIPATEASASLPTDQAFIFSREHS